MKEYKRLKIRLMMSDEDVITGSFETVKFDSDWGMNGTQDDTGVWA